MLTSRSSLCAFPIFPSVFFRRPRYVAIRSTSVKDYRSSAPAFRRAANASPSLEVATPDTFGSSSHSESHWSFHQGHQPISIRASIEHMCSNKKNETIKIIYIPSKSLSSKIIENLGLSDYSDPRKTMQKSSEFQFKKTGRFNFFGIFLELAGYCKAFHFMYTNKLI